MTGSRGQSTTVWPIVSNALTSCAEETFDAIDIVLVLGSTRLRRLALAVVHFLVVARVLQASTVVIESWLISAGSCIRLDRLHLTLQSVVNTLALIHWMIQTFGAANRLHSHIRAQRHALMDMAS